MRRADGCRLWTAETGRGTPLIVCHGGPGLWDMFGSLADALAGDVRVTRWDLRGCGRSQRRGAYSVAQSVADLDPLLHVIMKMVRWWASGGPSVGAC